MTVKRRRANRHSAPVTPGERVRKYRKEKKITQRALGEAIGWPTSSAEMYISRIETGKVRLQNDTAAKIAVILDVHLTDIIPDAAGSRRTVPLVGYVGAGDLYVWDADAGPWNGFEPVDAPPFHGPDTVALKIHNNLMAPVYKKGDIIYLSKVFRPPHELTGEDCMVRLRDGTVVLKSLQKGSRPDRYTLHSYNNEIPRQENADVKEASLIECVIRSRAVQPVK